MTDTSLALVVLAAGIGSRYGGLKQMDPVGPSGEIIIDYSVYDALAAGFDKVVFVISAAIQEAFRERIGRTIERQVETAYVIQRPDDLPAGWAAPAERKKPWGTGHATLAARGAVDSPFCVINADDFYGRTAYTAIADYLKRPPAGQPNDYCMVGYRLGNTLTEHGHVARGICEVDATGHLIGVRERTHIERYGAAARNVNDDGTALDLPLDAIVSMNIWGFRPGVLDALWTRFAHFLERNRADLSKVEFYLSNAVGDMVTDGEASVCVLPTDEVWHGVTYAQDKPRVHAAVRDLVHQGLYPENLWGPA
ncbi:MAG: hypothetical protein BWY52_00431 [Chloroflexi bacterium ADurb.Bin325]|nr:MAG: hypothetical protein BWY52_00431 [Chloroflexi bacterium ADurb.Bin325]